MWIVMCYVPHTSSLRYAINQLFMAQAFINVIVSSLAGNFATKFGRNEFNNDEVTWHVCLRCQEEVLQFFDEFPLRTAAIYGYEIIEVL